MSDIKERELQKTYLEEMFFVREPERKLVKITSIKSGQEQINVVDIECKEFCESCAEKVAKEIKSTYHLIELTGDDFENPVCCANDDCNKKLSCGLRGLDDRIETESEWDYYDNLCSETGSLPNDFEVYHE